MGTGVIADGLTDRSVGGGRVLAVASIYRDQESLRIEAAMERGDEAGVEALLRG